MFRLRAIASLSAALAGAALLAVPASASAGTSPFTVAVSTTVTGSIVDVSFTVTSDGTHAATALVQITDAQSPTLNPGQVQGRIDRTVALPSDCTATCSGDVTVDTARWEDPGSDTQANPTLDENLAQVAVVTVSGDPGSGIAPGNGESSWFSVDNQRHRLSYLTYDMRSDRSWHVMLSDSPMTASSAAPLANIVVTFPGHDDLHAPVTIGPPADPSRDPWAADMDTSAMPYGIWTARIVGFDTAGLATNVLVIPLVIDHGPRFTATLQGVGDPAPATLPDAATIHVDTTPSPDALIDNVDATLSIDGSLVQTKSDFGSSFDFPVGRNVFTAGAHTFSVTITSHTWSGPYGHEVTWATTHQDVVIDASDGPSIQPSTSGHFLTAGGTGRVLATLTAYPRTGIRSWEIDAEYSRVQSKTLCAVDTACPTSTSLSVPIRSFVAAGTRPVTIYATDTTGTTHVAFGTVHVDPSTLTTLSGPASVRRAATVRLRGRVTTWLGVGKSGVAVVLQRRWPGTTAWRKIATATTGKYGYVHFDRTVWQTAYWRLVTPEKVGCCGASRSGRLRVAAD